MKIKIILIIITLIFAVFLSINSVHAQSDLESRLELIEASQRLAAEQDRAAGRSRHQFGVALSNFGSEDNMLNPGFRLKNQLFSSENRSLNLITEGYYLRQEDDVVGFISLAFEPHPLVYLGAGAEVTGKANYQVFAGVNITDNIFVEAKAVNTEGSFNDSEVRFATGFMISF